MVQPRFVLREQFLCSIYPHQPHIAQLNYRQLFTADKREREKRSALQHLMMWLVSWNASSEQTIKERTNTTQLAVMMRKVGAWDALAGKRERGHEITAARGNFSL
jgi:hypothetical protein